MSALRHLVLAGLVLLPAAPAGAATARVDDGAGLLVVEAGPGERNRLSVSSRARDDGVVDEYRVRDELAVLEPGEGCRRDDADRQSVLCRALAGGGGTLAVQLGDGDDLFATAAGLPVRLDAGPGNDTVHGDPGWRTEQMRAEHPGSDVSAGETNELHGGPGDDLLSGGADGDNLYGGEGDDFIDGHAGNDALCGGGPPGDPRATLCGPLVATGADRLDGGAGRDLMLAGDGDNRLVGGPDKDHMESLDGADTIDATGDAPDPAATNPGTLLSYQHADQISAGAGDDTILAADGALDHFSCGAGTDSATRDRGDGGGLWDCEVVTPEFVLPPVVSLPAIVTVLPGGRLELPIACPVVLERGCSGPVEVHTVPTVPAARAAAVRRLARGRYSVQRGARRTVRLRLTARGRRYLRRNPRIQLLVRATNRAAPPSADARVLRVARLKRRR